MKGIICGAGLYLVARILCIIVTVALFALGKIESPVRLGLLIVHCNTLETVEHVGQVLRDVSKYLKIKNKMVSRNSVEIVYEYKTKNEQTLEQREFVGNYNVGPHEANGIQMHKKLK